MSEEMIALVAGQARKYKEQLLKQMRDITRQLDFYELLDISKIIAPLRQHFSSLLYYQWFLKNGKKTNIEWARREDVWGTYLRAAMLV